MNAFILLFIPCMLPGQAAIEVLSVCDVLSNRETYAGKTVTVRGKLHATREFFTLTDGRCAGQGVVWAGDKVHALSLRRLQFQPNAEPGSPSASDWRSIQVMATLLKFLDVETPQELNIEIEATFTGKLNADLSRSSTFPWPPPARGYGHLGGFAAELVYHRVTGMVIRQLPEPSPIR